MTELLRDCPGARVTFQLGRLKGNSVDTDIAKKIQSQRFVRKVSVVWTAPSKDSYSVDALVPQRSSLRLSHVHVASLCSREVSDVLYGGDRRTALIDPVGGQENGGAVAVSEIGELFIAVDGVTAQALGLDLHCRSRLPVPCRKTLPPGYSFVQKIAFRDSSFMALKDDRLCPFRPPRPLENPTALPDVRAETRAREGWSAGAGGEGGGGRDRESRRFERVQRCLGSERTTAISLCGYTRGTAEEGDADVSMTEASGQKEEKGRRSSAPSFGLSADRVTLLERRLRETGSGDAQVSQEPLSVFLTKVLPGDGRMESDSESGGLIAPLDLSLLHILLFGDKSDNSDTDRTISRERRSAAESVARMCADRRTGAARRRRSVELPSEGEEKGETDTDGESGEEGEEEQKDMEEERDESSALRRQTLEDLLHWVGCVHCSVEVDPDDCSVISSVPEGEGKSSPLAMHRLTVEGQREPFEMEKGTLVSPAVASNCLTELLKSEDPLGGEGKRDGQWVLVSSWGHPGAPTSFGDAPHVVDQESAHDLHLLCYWPHTESGRKAEQVGEQTQQGRASACTEGASAEAASAQYVLISVGKLDEAIAKWGVLAQKQEKSFGFESRTYMESFREITRLLEKQGKLDEAIAKWGVLAQKQEKFFGFESRLYMESFREITRLLEKQGKLDEAIAKCWILA
uniref:Uncharacterized protein n=1 Tax=Chromera velia CCMP2878 TaxID=1169474 RepID=A0A0G4HBV8_9ALVE|eukprot:Cvel_6179.t1-p1 / transcript=Cvel_6179.t1 / gene=Cvel_6179 / organism=Chromera_velia_CCMP2878 / gene_product=hypothetical protein / transcript_product=hypothetical protein / location=Cvel_scaffold299:37261-42524(-) / protein_length=686 / sequence_SO=supercontig / SO=protein_coding / is_pseudo=false